MSLRWIVVGLFACAVGVLLAVVSLKPKTNNYLNLPKLSPPSDETSDAGIPDCAANSVYIMTQLLSRPVPYAKCLEMLPPNPSGTSIYDVRATLQTLGISAEALRFQSEEVVREKSLLIIYEPGATYVSGNIELKAQMGHFLVVRPISEGEYQFLDFPQPRSP